MIDQITVFLENEKGRLAALCNALGEANISMHALTVADTAQYGVARIIADAPREAVEVLSNQGFRASLTSVFAVEVDDHAGGLAKLLAAFDNEDINVEYAYCFSTAGGKAIDILRIDNREAAQKLIADGGFKLLVAKDLYAQA